MIKEGETKMNRRKHMQKKKHRFLYYLVAAVVLLAIVSVTFSYISAKNSDNKEPTTTNRNVVAGSKKNSSKVDNKSYSSEEASSQTSTQDDLEHYKYEVPQQIQGTWYYYDTDGSIQTLTFTEHSMILTGSNAYSQTLYTEEARSKTRPDLDSAIATTGTQKKKHSNVVQVVKISNWDQSGNGEAFNINYDMFDYRYLSQISTVTNSEEGMYFPSVKELQADKQKADDYRSAEDAAGYSESEESDENSEPEDTPEISDEE